MTAGATLKRVMGPRLTTTLRCLTRGYELPRWGNLRRTRPFSASYGFERGTPIDRFYLHRFLTAQRALITGDVLEVQVNSTTERYGTHVRRADTFDIVADFAPTYLVDFTTSPNAVPSGAYDCVLLPNALPHFRDLDGGLRSAHRVLRPGGVMLASAGGMTPLTGDVPDYWRFSPEGWRERLRAVWPGAEIRVEGHGNCLAAVAAQLGLAVEELTDAELGVYDPRFPVLITMVCRA